MKLNLLIILPFFFQSGNRSKPQQPFQTPGLPTECARMTLESFQKSSPPPALIPFFPPNRCCRPGKEATCVTLTPRLMAIFGEDKFFWIPSIIPPSSLRQPLAGFRDGGPSLKRRRRLLTPHLSTNSALRAASLQRQRPRPRK